MTRKQVQQAAETAAEAARARLLERGVAWTRPMKAELGNGCPHCAAAEALARLNDDDEPYVPRSQTQAWSTEQRTETVPQTITEPRTETVLKETRTAPRRRPRVTSVPIRHTF